MTEVFPLLVTFHTICTYVIWVQVQPYVIGYRLKFVSSEFQGVRTNGVLPHFHLHRLFYSKSINVNHQRWRTLKMLQLDRCNSHLSTRPSTFLVFLQVIFMSEIWCFLHSFYTLKILLSTLDWNISSILTTKRDKATKYRVITTDRR